MTFFQFPGHTWLQQDSQIYVPILETPAAIPRFCAMTFWYSTRTSPSLYDEARPGAPRRHTGARLSRSARRQQIATRAVGIWGLLLMAEALGLAFAPRCW